MSTDELSVDLHDRHLSITLQRPHSANALSPDMVEAFIESLTHSTDVSSCTIRGAGKNFCAGFDLSEIETLSDGDLLLRFVRIEQLLQRLHHAPFPVMALAQGHVVGAGADLFAACWQRIAAPDCRFKMPGWNFELALGTRRLTQLVGSDAARDLLIDTSTADADKAAHMGLASAIVKPQDWPEHVERFKQRATALPANAVPALLSLTANDSRAADMAALIESASKPGLKARIQHYRAALQKR